MAKCYVVIVRHIAVLSGSNLALPKHRTEQTSKLAANLLERIDN